MTLQEQARCKKDVLLIVDDEDPGRVRGALSQGVRIRTSEAAVVHQRTPHCYASSQVTETQAGSPWHRRCKCRPCALSALLGRAVATSKMEMSMSSESMNVR